MPGTPTPSRASASTRAAPWVSAAVIPLLQVPPLRGRSFADAEDLPRGPEVAIISEALWRNAFGADGGILGRNVEIGGKTREIVGLMPRRVCFPDATTQVWLPLALDPAATNSGGFNYSAVARRCS